LLKFGIKEIRQFGAHGAGVVVAVVDSGVNASDPDLAGSLVPGADFSQSQPLDNPGTDTSDMDTKETHGTGIASMIASHGHVEATTNGQPTAGLIGLADGAKIMPIKVGDGPSDQDQAIANGIMWAARHHARVINISIGSNEMGDVVRQAINQADADNSIVVAAAGNNGAQGNPTTYPAAFSGLIAVSGISKDGTFWPESEYGSNIDIAGPAQDVPAYVNGSYDFTEGTSGAAAYVSAEAALVIGAHPSWTAGQVIRAMLSTATPGPGQTQGQRSDQFGYGIMNPYAALQAPEPSDTSNPLLAPASTQPVTNPSVSAPSQNGAASGGNQPTVPPAAKSGSGKSSNTGVIIGGVAGGVALLAIIITWAAVSSSRRRRNLMPAGPTGYGPPPGPGMPPYQGPGQPPPGGGYPGGPFPPPNGQPPQGPTAYPPGRR
jgi:subtilisin family serine protease